MKRKCLCLILEDKQFARNMIWTTFITKVCTQYILALCLTLLALGQVTQGARILALFPMPATSHQNVLTALTKALAEKGHDLTVVTSISQKKALSNYKEIILENFLARIFTSQGNINFYEWSKMSAYEMTLMLWGVGNTMCEGVLPDPKIQALIKSNEKFDLILIEAFNYDCFLGFSHKFQAPIIQISPMGVADGIGDATGNPTPYAYVPDFSFNFDHHMNFQQRLSNTLLGIFKTLGRNVFYMPRQNGIIQKYFKGTGPGPVPHISELNSMTSLMLLNNHVSISSPRPYLPNVIEVGGMHISPPKKLPQDLQKYLDDAKEGVVYFSMGSNIQGSDMPDSKRDAFLTAFSKLKQKVLWKWETESLPGQPKNVKLGKWFPQSDLLAHPNVKLFITHGGLLSTQEALYHGMPIIGIPVYGDQPMNMKRAVTTGYAVRVDFDNVTTEGLTVALKEVLDNSKYRETAQTLSRVFRDQPQTPLETAVFWTEYVLRHKGAHHLRSAALDLCWFQYHLLDVLAVLGVGVLAILIIVYLTLRTLLRCILPSKKKTQVNVGKKKNN